MRVLVIARCKNGSYAPFITEQVEAIRQKGVECQYLAVTGDGIWGYLRQLPLLKKTIHEFCPDIIHAHYGLCGLLANFQRRVPVVTTYHGSDINDPKVLRLSSIAIKWSHFNIFVSQNLINIARPEKEYVLLPCGVCLEDYPLIDKAEARRRMTLLPDKKYVLFAGAFDNRVKNVSLAEDSIKLLPETKLLELKGYNRQQVATLMQAVDALIMTSFSEGSPQVIKEALACGCPLVSVDVGDVKDLTKGVDGCFIAERNPHDIASKLRLALSFGHRTSGRNSILKRCLTNDIIADRIIDIYNLLLHPSVYHR